MPLSQSDFIARHPEFASTASTNPGLVSAALADANAEIDDETWGDKAARGQGLHAASSLARSPMGLQSALVGQDGDVKKPIYEGELDRLRMIVGGRNRAVMP